MALRTHWQQELQEGAWLGSGLRLLEVVVDAECHEHISQHHDHVLESSLFFLSTEATLLLLLCTVKSHNDKINMNTWTQKVAKMSVPPWISFVAAMHTPHAPV